MGSVKTWIWIVIGVVVGLGVASLLYSTLLYNYYPGYLSAEYHYTGYNYFSYGSVFSINRVLNESMSIPSNARVYPSNDTIVFTGSDINLIVVAMMGDDAVNMTGEPLPPYAHDDVFVIYGLINPTLVIPVGAVVHVTFVNLDDDMYHNFIVTSVPPPYPYNVMPYVGMYSGYMGPGMMYIMHWLPPANYKAGYAYGYEYTFTINEPGTYWYLCTYPGHAQEGMYGEIIATGNTSYRGLNQYYAYPGMGPGMMRW